MVESVTVFLVIIVSLAMATLGNVLLVRFWIGNTNFSSRVAVAAAGGPLLVLLPMILIIARDGQTLFVGLIGLGLIIAISAVIIGWPISYFATKKLDKLTQFDVGTFR